MSLHRGYSPAGDKTEGQACAVWCLSSGQRSKWSHQKAERGDHLLIVPVVKDPKNITVWAVGTGRGQLDLAVPCVAFEEEEEEREERDGAAGGEHRYNVKHFAKNLV